MRIIRVISYMANVNEYISYVPMLDRSLGESGVEVISRLGDIRKILYFTRDFREVNVGS
ncbi:unnamed protein product [marine sediment metagenome]|uniref:Uncharacterized protein n=1 Tax=marine sediment metagenome TaxID=412755 RepID=X1RJT4_9ZZZZ